MSFNYGTHDIDTRRVLHTTQDPKDVAITYAKLCKHRSIDDVMDVVNLLKGGCNTTYVCNQSCTSINTVSKIKLAYEVLGEKNTVNIANRMCKRQCGGAGTESTKTGQSQTSTTSVGRKKSFSEHLDTISSGAEKSVATVEKMADTADKFAVTAVRLTDTGVKIGSALAGLYNAVKSQTNRGTTQPSVKKLVEEGEVTAKDVTTNPKTSIDVLKNIKYLEDQLELKDVEIKQQAQEIEQLRSQYQQCKLLLTKSASVSSVLGTQQTNPTEIGTLQSQVSQLEAQIAIYTKTIDELKAQHIQELEKFKRDHTTALEALKADMTQLKNKECDEKIAVEVQKRSASELQKLTGQLDALIKLQQK